MAAANKDILINILTKAAGTSSVKELNSVLSSLNQNTVSIGKNNQFYQKGVAGSISSTKALSQVSAGLAKVVQQQAVAMRAANAARAAEIKAIELSVRAKKAEFSQDELALKQLRQELQLRELAIRERRAAIAETRVSAQETARAATVTTSAISQQNAAIAGTGHVASTATFALTSLGQGLADAGQFGMGFAQGMRAITNNAQQVVFAMVMLRQQAGTAAASFAALRAVMTGPLGFLFAFQAISAGIEGYLSWAQRAKKANKELSDSFSALLSVIGGPDRQNIAFVDLQERIRVIRTEMEGLGLAAEPLTKRLLGLWGGYARLSDVFSDAAKKGAELRAELKKFEELLDGRGPSLSQDEEYRAFLQNEINALESKIVESQNRVRAAGDTYFTELKEREALMSDVATSGAKSVSEFEQAYASFSVRLRGIGEEIDRSQFAKLFRDGDQDEFFSKKYKEFILERIDSTINAMERLNRAANRFGAGAAPRGLQSNIASRIEEIRRSATLVGRLDGVEGVGSGELRMMSDATLSEMDRLGTEIEARNRAGTDSWRAHWIARTEASVKAASIVSSSVGDIGTVFMQLAQTGDRSNKRMFETGKKFAIAQALISTYVGFTKALEQRGPLGLVAGAAVLASGMAKVAAIRATTMNGSGGSGSSGASGVSSAPTFFTGFGNVSDFPGSSPSFPIVPLNQQTVNINLSASGRDLVGVIESEASASQRRIGGGAVGASMFSASRSSGILSTGNRDNLVI